MGGNGADAARLVRRVCSDDGPRCLFTKQKGLYTASGVSSIAFRLTQLRSEPSYFTGAPDLTGACSN
jgi:hypothetical protein